MIIGMIRYAIPDVFTDLKSRNVNQLYEEPYFTDRFNIFRKITLESFKNQTNKDFILLVYHTNQIPEDKKALFDEIEKEYKFVRNIYIPDSNMYIPDDLKEKRQLTFRIDNDDGIAIDFIERLQNVKKSEKGNIVICTPNVYEFYRMNLDTYKIGFIYHEYNSMGLAYLSDDGKTIMNLGNHTKIAKNYKVKNISGNGGLQILNTYNVANNFKVKNKSCITVLKEQDMKKLLMKKDYANLDISCIPVMKEKK